MAQTCGEWSWRCALREGAEEGFYDAGEHDLAPFRATADTRQQSRNAVALGRGSGCCGAAEGREG
eukprot:354192-Chlamydomonas_euryale.AAC.3